jgi:transcription antitermination factor NusB
MARSRRKARVAAMQILYEIEIAKTPMADAINENLMANPLTTDLEAYAERIVKGFYSQKFDMDERLRNRVSGYGLDRIAAVDRNVLRVAMFEMFNVEELPPAVIIDEAIEIAKKYSTAESGKFVHGVLGRIVQESPKANWVAPAEADEEEPIEADEPEEEITEETVTDDSEAGKQALRFGWVLKSGDPEIPANTD